MLPRKHINTKGATQHDAACSRRKLDKRLQRSKPQRFEGSALAPPAEVASAPRVPHEAVGTGLHPWHAGCSLQGPQGPHKQKDLTNLVSVVPLVLGLRARILEFVRPLGPLCYSSSVELSVVGGPSVSSQSSLSGFFYRRLNRSKGIGRRAADGVVPF